MLNDVLGFQNVDDQNGGKFHKTEQTDHVDHHTLCLADLDLIEEEGKADSHQQSAVEVAEERSVKMSFRALLEAVEEGEDDGSGGDGQTVVLIAYAAFGGAALFFAYVKVCQTDQTCQNVERHDDEILFVQTVADAHDGGQHAEANKVCQRVELDSEFLFVIGTFFTGTGDLAVKQIEKSA